MQKQLLRKPRLPKTTNHGSSDISCCSLPSSSGIIGDENLRTRPSSGILDCTAEKSTPVSNKQVKVTKSDTKWIIDPNIMSRKSTCISNSSSCKPLLKPRKTRGPDPLPPGDVRKQYPYLIEYIRSDDDIRYHKPPLFTLNDFILKLSQDLNISIDKIQKCMFSSSNYTQITQLIAQKLHKRNEEISFIDIDIEALENVENISTRIPQHQTLMELAATIKEHVKEALQIEVKCVIRKLPKFTPCFKLGEAPHSEIVVYEKEKDKEIKRMEVPNRLNHPTNETLFTSANKPFQDSTRASSPFYTAESQISPSEIAILDCLMSGGIALSLKANFISELPDISPLTHTLTYLNISYNCFKEIPSEVFLLKNLQILKIRNNPLSILPLCIDQLSCLESLIVSFCLLTTIPISLYKLEKLRILDISYNKISFLHKEIQLLRNLRFLNVEGNELTSLPFSVLRLKLQKLRLRNNFMHPLLWEENCTAQPQRLLDLAALSVLHYELDKRYGLRELSESSDLKTETPILSNEMKSYLIDRATVCDCCAGPRFGSGLRLIRPSKKLFGVRFVPLLFFSCSPRCRQSFLTGDADASLKIYDTKS